MALTRRQREVLEVIRSFITQHGYSPSLEEIGAALGLSSVATVHKHVSHLVDKGLVRRIWNQNRSIDLVPDERDGEPAAVLPLMGTIAAGSPLEAVRSDEAISVPADMVPGRGAGYVLRVRGDSMIDEQIRDGDFVVVEERPQARDGETVVALVDGHEATLKRLYREGATVRLQPANATMGPIVLAADRVQVQGVVVGVIRKY
jgi:repressor LexA